ncbi:MAG: long-chain acyl-CoA synthetase, partial [Sphingomonadales bacterium]|nr:long-chain acyl-CoA synthetase [Sphingomonadales bacterium]
MSASGGSRGKDVRRFEHFPNLVTMFFTRAAEKGDAPFLWAKIEKKWSPISWREAAERVASLAAALRKLGLRPGDMVMLVSENRPEWCIADLAIMAAGCVTVPTYTTNTERDHQHIIDDSGARAVIVSTQKLAKSVLPAAQRSSGCEHVIAIEPLPGGQTSNIQYHDWAALLGSEPPDVAGCAAGADFGRGDLACLIYTSGTGGAPRGVM